ncbi:MAG TPA: PH domain-containing protein [Cryptosporangiaceae bacterium]|nr:PH domain-containing protein [Cryptosporangiaceae bacterium]
MSAEDGVRPTGEVVPGGVVRARPRRVRVVCWIAAVSVVAVFTTVAMALRSTDTTSAGGVFGVGDQVAMVVLGLFVAAGILAFARPRVEADAHGIRIRNVVGGYTLPWEIVRAVRFGDGAACASLELADDDTVAVLAIQAVDKEYALAAVRGLRALLAEAHTRQGGP